MHVNISTTKPIVFYEITSSLIALYALYFPRTTFMRWYMILTTIMVDVLASPKSKVS